MNMDYCKYELTLSDMRQCLRALEAAYPTSERECEYAEVMFEDILTTMLALGVIDDYDQDLLNGLCQEMNEDRKEEHEYN